MSANLATSDSLPCPACGYDLRGTPASERCPECGNLLEEIRGKLLESVQETIRTQKNLTELGGVTTVFVLISVIAWPAWKMVAAALLMIATGLYMLAVVGQFCHAVIVLLGTINRVERNMIFAAGFGRLLGINIALLILIPMIVILAMYIFR